MPPAWRLPVLSLLAALLLASLLWLLALPAPLSLALAALGACAVPLLGRRGPHEQIDSADMQHFVQRLIDAIPQPIYVKDAEARFLMVNEAFAHERRRPASELIGLSSFDLSPSAAMSQTINDEDHAVLAGHAVFKEQHTTYPVTGEECYRLVSKRLCQAPNGQPLIIGAHVDITSLRQTEAGLQQAVARESLQRERIQTWMQRLINVIPQPVYVKDANSRYLLVNEAFCNDRMLAAAELLGKTPFDLARDPAHARKVMAEDQEVLNGGKVYKEELIQHPVTGEPRYRVISKGSCPDADGHPVIVGANFDITSWRQAEQNWRQASAAKSQFLAAMSHEIRTPLSGVIGSLRLALRAPGLEDEARSYIQTGLGSAESLLAIINDILDFSKIEAGQLRLEQIDFELATTVREATQSFRDSARARGLAFETSIDPQVPPFLKGDPTRLRQILINLIGNAVKFTERGSVTLRLRCSPAPEGSLRLFGEVEDSGVGIPPEAQERLFQVFQQADLTTTRRFGGTGLGLAICRQLVEAMGGSISLRSQPGQGSCFSFDLLLAPGRSTVPPEEAPITPHSHRLRILCAEDVRVNQLILRGQLVHMGHEVEIAENGRAAVQALAQQDYDLVLMDGRMPEMDGAEASRAIRAGGLPGCAVRNPSIRIVAVTANASDEDRDYYLAAGMDDFLTKPLREDALHTIIKDTIAGLATEGRLNARHALRQ
ncbi:ATP-binding protein [Uliginosibacterium sp. TH139]|uniref:ATP-binding protein n=1 Tax=Uliginosibacterium sp. TH139 TaxID=2067453 RepID=UPI00130440AE|nr:ATP-binding protein [Uliginosibacterium sp. TH139]